ncbi:histidine phosphotransferase family protein [Halovulum sp. GXIMD14794]
MTGAELSALVSTRICHDLISPIGAISNGVELLGETAGAASPELGLIGDSVNSAAARLRFFRLAFGAAQPGTRVALTDLRAGVESLLGGGRSRIVIDALDAQIPRQTAKLLLLALLCQEMALPLGGDSQVNLTPTGFRIDTRASRMRDLAPLWAIAERAKPAEHVAPGEVQFLLLGMALAELGTPLVRQMREDGLSLEVAGLPG